MSTSGKLPLDNAVEIIEKFGGIRPMASKTGVAVTTIQGWKKRGVIPAAREGAILAAAQEHGVDLSVFIEGEDSSDDSGDVGSDEAQDAEEIAEEVSSPDHSGGMSSEIVLEEKEEAEEEESVSETVSAADDDEAEEDDSESEEKAEEEEDAGKAKEDDLEIPIALRRTAGAEGPKVRPAAAVSEKDYREFVLEGKKPPVNRTVIIMAVIALLILAALAGMLMKKEWNTEQRDARIEELENRLSAVKKEQSSFKGLVPENWSEELEQLKRQAEQVKKEVSNTVENVKDMSRDLTSAEGISDRVVQLQTYVSEISGEKGVYALKARFDKMRSDYNGSKILNNSVQALLPLIQASEDDERVNELISQERERSPALQASFGNVPKNELKAAAMLLAMTQVRSALNRPETEFDSDLSLLMGMVGEDDVELRGALEKLAPYSKEGVLTPSGLKSEFQSVAGEAVAASLRGEDVSVSEKLSAKFNELLKVEKDGELLTGTQTQATVSKAEKLVEADRFEEAVSMLKSGLRTKELEPLRPWIRKAEGMIASKSLSGMIEEAIELNFGPGLLGGKVLEKKQY